MSEPSIATLDAKINSFIDSQDKHNDKVTNAIGKIADTVADINTLRSEINHLSSKHTQLENDIHLMGRDQKEISDKVLTNSIQAEEYKWVKKLVVSFFILTALGGGYMTKTSLDNSAQQAASMAEIVKAIKSSQIN